MARCAACGGRPSPPLRFRSEHRVLSPALRAPPEHDVLSLRFASSPAGHLRLCGLDGGTPASDAESRDGAGRVDGNARRVDGNASGQVDGTRGAGRWERTWRRACTPTVVGWFVGVEANNVDDASVPQPRGLLLAASPASSALRAPPSGDTHSEQPPWRGPDALGVAPSVRGDAIAESVVSCVSMRFEAPLGGAWGRRLGARAGEGEGAWRGGRMIGRRRGRGLGFAGGRPEGRGRFERDYAWPSVLSFAGRCTTQTRSNSTGRACDRALPPNPPAVDWPGRRWPHTERAHDRGRYPRCAGVEATWFTRGPVQQQGRTDAVGRATFRTLRALHCARPPVPSGPSALRRRTPLERCGHHRRRGSDDEPCRNDAGERTYVLRTPSPCS